MRTKSDFPRIKDKAFLSPMSGITDIAFRGLARNYKAGLTYTEFVSSSAIVRENEKSLSMLRKDRSENPAAVQIFGSSIKELADAAGYLEERFDIIDINCGCPAYKVIKTGAGSALLNNPEKIGHLVSKLSSAISKPITIKIRKGTDDKHINALKVAKIAEDSGAAAVAIHGRTQKQGYSGEADWKIIKEVKDALNIPVIGNGDVFTPEVFNRRLEESGVDYILIARGAIGNPYLFRQIADLQKNGTYSYKDGIEQFKEYLRLAESYRLRFIQIKNHAIHFTKGIETASRIRDQLSKSKDIDELKKIILSVKENKLKKEASDET